MNSDNLYGYHKNLFQNLVLSNVYQPKLINKNVFLKLIYHCTENFYIIYVFHKYFRYIHAWIKFQIVIPLSFYLVDVTNEIWFFYYYDLFNQIVFLIKSVEK